MREVKRYYEEGHVVLDYFRDALRGGGGGAPDGVAGTFTTGCGTGEPLGNLGAEANGESARRAPETINESGARRTCAIVRSGTKPSTAVAHHWTIAPWIAYSGQYENHDHRFGR